jgi:hypothetical protein
VKQDAASSAAWHQENSCKIDKLRGNKAYYNFAEFERFTDAAVNGTKGSGGTMVKTALYETLIDSCTKNDDGTMTFPLEGKIYIINDFLEIAKIAQEHDYIIIY